MKIYFVEYVFFKKIDKTDGERVELRLGAGFWVNEKKMAVDLIEMKKNLNKGWRVEKKAFDVLVKRRQKNLYVLNYEYDISDGTTFYYQFEPQTSYKKCWEQMKELVNNSKYKNDSTKICTRGRDGWFVEKYEIVW